MKKLMVAFCAVAMAVVANAGAAKWSAIQIQASPAGAYTTGTKYCAYFFVGDDVTAATKYLSGDTFNLDSFKAASLDSNTATYNSDTGLMNFANKASGTFKGQTVTAYMIIFDAESVDDAKNYLVAVKNSSPYVSQTFGDQGDKTFAWSSQATNTNWQSVGNVPEPTSAMLMLLGVAGLALRRRRA